MDLAHLIEALAKPTAYRERVEAVAVRQTHISVVFLAGELVYKVKKPVNLGFLDFSTLEKRHHFCEQEVNLNRRLAPEVYLGVVPVVRTEKEIQFEGEGEVLEWAVKMRHLPDEATLLARLQRGEVGIDLVEELARKIADFHRTAEDGERIAAFGRFEAVSRVLLANFDRAAAQVGTTVKGVVFDRVRTLTVESLAQLRPLIEARAAGGMTRDTHGDLRLDHVYHFPEKAPPADLVILDCIEFNESFRFTDPVADMAFLVMDLAFRGRRDLARAFADAYFSASGDQEGRALLSLYTAYRATVRATVKGLLLAEKEVAEDERAAALASARAHWLLALTELEKPGRKPCLVLVGGLPGTGKSSLARGLAERADFCVLRSDVIRKELAGLSSQSPTPPQLREQLYTPEWTQKTYAECLRRAEELLFDGKRVLVDATLREEQNRADLLQAALRWGVPGVVLICQAKPETVRQWLEQRRGDASDADWAIHVEAAEQWEEAEGPTRAALHEISTDGSPEQGLSKALDVLRELGFQG